MQQVTCIQLFTYEGFSSKFWAFKMMQFAHKHFKNVNGLRFYKLMGSGKDFGFNPLPDWSTYALLTVWDDSSYATNFFENSDLFVQYKTRATRIQTHFMTCVKSHGLWSNQNPFEINTSASNKNSKIAVITRATIRKRHLLKFWNYVPESTKMLKRSEDLIYTKGIGEVPIIQMATFSIWNNFDAIKKFAYRDKHHQKAIQMTKKYNWYKEEMFSRFVIDRTEELV